MRASATASAPTTCILTVPTPEMYNGDFSNWVNASNQLLPDLRSRDHAAEPSGAGFIRDPFAGQPDSGSAVQRVRQQVVPFGQARQAEPRRRARHRAYVRNNYITTGGTIATPTEQGSVKVDHCINAEPPARLLLQHHATSTRQSGRADLPDCRCRCGTARCRPSTPRPTASTHDWTISPAHAEPLLHRRQPVLQGQRTRPMPAVAGRTSSA